MRTEEEVRTKIKQLDETAAELENSATEFKSLVLATVKKDQAKLLRWVVGDLDL